jgi:hypothetical protein
MHRKHQTRKHNTLTFIMLVLHVQAKMQMFILKNTFMKNVMKVNSLVNSIELSPNLRS